MISVNKSLNYRIIEITCALLAIPGMISAQGWLPLQQGEIYNYRKTDESLICSNIWITSAQFAPGDSVY